MLNCKKTIAILGIVTLIFMQGLPGLNIRNSRAEAATCPAAMQEIMSRPYPRLMGNQWHVAPDGTFGAGNTASTIDFAGKYLDYVSLNRASGGMNDLFLDFYQSTHDPTRGLLKTSNDLHSAAAAAGRKIYVLAYHNMSDVWYYESVNSFPNENFWMKPDGKNIGTWDYMNNHNLWLHASDGSIVTYPGYTSSQRRMWDSRNQAVQEYWAQHAKGITDQGFDGIFADNWLRTGFGGTDRVGVQQGWNATGARFKQLAPNKILVGNSPPFGVFTNRDVCMLEDRIAQTATGDKSIAGYLQYSDQAAAMGQVCQDTYWDEAAGPLETFRIPMVLLTDNVFGLTLSTKQGHPLSSESSVIIKLGKIGYPKGPRYTANGVLQRDFTLGKDIVNNTGSTVTVNLPAGVYKTINGTQVNSVTLNAYSGIVLKTSGSVPPPAPTAPAAPSGLTVTGVTKGATTGNYFVNLSWTDNSTNETGFELQQAVNSTTNFQTVGTIPANTTAYAVNLGTTPTAGTYYYRLLAVNDTGKSAPSNTASANVTIPTVPAAPTGLAIASVTKGATTGNYYVNLTWKDNATNETGYKIFQSVNSATNFQLVKTAATNATSYGVSIGTTPVSGTYYYKVVATNAAGDSQPSNTVSKAISTVNPPAAPSNLAVTKVAKSLTSGDYFVYLTWKDNSTNETGFQILQSINSTSNFQVVKTPAMNSTSYGVNIGSTPVKGTYYYKVIAVNAGGNSASSNTAQATVK